MLITLKVKHLGEDKGDSLEEKTEKFGQYFW